MIVARGCSLALMTQRSAGGHRLWEPLAWPAGCPVRTPWGMGGTLKAAAGRPHLEGRAG